MIPKANPAGVVMSVKPQILGPPPTMQTAPQPLPPPMPFKPPAEPKKTPPISLLAKVGISQNKNPNIGLNMKNGIEILPNTKNFEKLSENLRNISNIIPLTRPAPHPMVPPIKTKPSPSESPADASKMTDIVPSKKSEEVWEKK